MWTDRNPSFGQKLAPVTTPAKPDRRSATKASAVRAASAALNGKTIMASAPASAKSRARWSILVRGKGCDIRRKEAHGMGIKGGYKRRSARRTGAINRASGNGLVPGVKPIKIAQRDDTAPPACGQSRAAIQSLHKWGYRKASAGLKGRIARGRDQSCGVLGPPARPPVCR